MTTLKIQTPRWAVPLLKPARYKGALPGGLHWRVGEEAMTDRELLELSAKAAGIVLIWHGDQNPWCFAERLPGIKWNPLADDGDALRLAVKLRMMIAWDRWNNNDCVCIRHRDLDEEIGILIDQSPEKTTRRAIVTAAAEIGRGKE